MKWLQIATEPEDVRRALARLGIAPRGPPKAMTMTMTMSELQISLPFKGSC